MRKTISERGQSLVELSISLVIILWLLAGAVEFGIALFQYIQLRDAAQEGALYGSICPVQSKIIERVRNASSSPIDLSVTSGTDAVTVCVDEEDGNDCNLGPVVPGGGVYVEVSYNHTLFMPFATLFTGGSTTIPITASVTNTVLDNDTSKTVCQ